LFESGLMNFRMISALVFGVCGTAVLCGLGTWQVLRMYEKRLQLDEIVAGISVAAVEVPEQLDPDVDRYRPVFAEGRFTDEALYVISGKSGVGAGVRVISVFEFNGRRILVDRGFLPEDQKARDLTVTDAKISGNLMWPRDSDAYTPPPDPKTGLWFARDAVAMAAQLQTEPVFVVANAPTGDGIEAMGVDTSSIPNDQWGYAITWFSLAAVWAVMTAVLVWRIRATKGVRA
jgi:surfeit locus 1 family protein